MFNEYNEKSEPGYDINAALGYKMGLWRCIGINLGIALGTRIAAIFALRNLL